MGATMTTTALPHSVRRRFGARVWGSIVAAWGVITGIAPHVLHHVGPLAGAALLAGMAGKAIFFALGLVLSLPLLRRLYRRFHTLVAPVLAVAVFAAVFALSSLVVAPRITGSGNAPATGGKPTLSEHARHHDGGGR